MHRTGYLDAMIDAARISRAAIRRRYRLYKMRHELLADRSRNAIKRIEYAEGLIGDEGIYFEK